MFPPEVLRQTALDGGPELFSGQAALVGIILGVSVFLSFLLVVALTYAGTRKKVVIHYLPRVVGQHGLPLLLVAILAMLLGAIYLMILLWPPSLGG